MDVKSLSVLPPWEWPPDAVATLLDALRDEGGDEADRLLAVELAGDGGVMNDELASCLLERIRDAAEAEAIRGGAAIALGPTLEELEWDIFEGEEEGSPVSGSVATAIRETLRAIYLDGEAPKRVRRRALEASVRGVEDWHAAAVRASYRSGDDEWRRTAVFCMSFVPGFDGEILEALESEDEALFYEAVRAAGEWGIEGAWPRIHALIEAGEEIEKPLLLAAIEGVATIKPELAPEILAELAESEDDEIADAVLEALAMARGLSAGPENPL